MADEKSPRTRHGEPLKGPKQGRKKTGKPVIRASEIGAYTYCRRAWWLRRVGGFEPEGRHQLFEKGQQAHTRHGRTFRRSQRQRRVAFLLLAFGLLLVGLAVLNFLTTIT